MADCASDLIVVGMQPGEQVATAFRLVALCISLSIVIPWFDRKFRAHLGLFFLHWSSGVGYLLSQFVMSVMILNCWSTKASEKFIFFLKFVEMTSLNLWAFSSMAIALLLAVIVKSFKECRRVPPMVGSPALLLACLGMSLAVTISSAVFWNELMVTGGYFWVTNNECTKRSRWISFSFAFSQVLAAFVMVLALFYIISPSRMASLKACSKASSRMKYYLMLTAWGAVVNSYNGVVTLFDQFEDQKLHRKLVLLGWISKYIHEIADTVILIGAIKSRQEYLVGRHRPNRTGSGSGELPRVIHPSSRRYNQSTTKRSPVATFTVMTPIFNPAGASSKGTKAASPLPRVPEDSQDTQSTEYKEDSNGSAHTAEADNDGARSEPSRSDSGLHWARRDAVGGRREYVRADPRSCQLGSGYYVHGRYVREVGGQRLEAEGPNELQ